MELPTIVLLAPIIKAQAYLDPGSGSFILQLVIATLLGGAFLIKTYWAKIRAFVTRLFTRKDTDPHDE